MRKRDTDTVMASEDHGDWPRSADAYELKHQIGQGAFAKVYQARCIANDTDIAIKVMELDNLTLSLEDIYQEVRVMLLSKNPHVLPAYACFVVKRSLWLVMPLMRKGSCLRIMKVLKRKGFGDGMKEEWIALILKSALLGLEYFHNHGQLHRDIKASNLLMDQDGSVRISDFGVAGWLPSGNKARNATERRTFVGTPCWMAPEVMEQTAPYDEKADIWSFGITALELAKGYAPYARLQPMKVLLMTIQGDPPSLKTYPDYAKTKNKFSRHFREIITLCLQKNPAHRPSASTLLSKTFFKRATSNKFLAEDLLENWGIVDSSVSVSSGDRTEQQTVLDQVRRDQEEEINKQRIRNSIRIDASAAQHGQDIESSKNSSAADESAVPDTDNRSAQATSISMSGPNHGKQSVASKNLAFLNKDEYMPGSTWVFDDDDADVAGNASSSAAYSGGVTKNSGSNSLPSVVESAGEANNPEHSLDSGFEAFASEYAKMDIRGEDGKPKKSS